MKIRAGSYWTASRAATIHKPYRIATGNHNNAFCPLCAHLSPTAPPLDTAGHILGACPLLSAPIIARHNRAVTLLHRYISTGSLGGNFTILDATSRRSLPPGVFSNRIPTWILPQVDPTTLDRVRPDILILHGLPHSLFASLQSALQSPDPSVSEPALRTLQHTCTVHIVELGYTSDRSLSSSIIRKQAPTTQPPHSLPPHSRLVSSHLSSNPFSPSHHATMLMTFLPHKIPLRPSIR